eukprot:140172-Chlamydomonas_euryale.AAC.1
MHQETLRKMIALASILCARCNYAEAKAMFQQALDGLRVVCGEHADETLKGIYGMALCVFLLSRSNGAVEPVRDRSRPRSSTAALRPPSQKMVALTTMLTEQLKQLENRR